MYYGYNTTIYNPLFAVKLLTIREKQMPELNDAFASDVSEFSTLDELKKDIKAKIKADKEKQAEREVENKLIEKIVENAEVNVPECMVNNQINREIEEMKRSLASQGMSYEMYLAYTNMTDSKLRDSRKEITEKQIKTTLVLSEIVKQENIKVEESDFDAKVEELAANMKKKPSEIKKTMNPNQKEVIENNIISDKVIKLLKEKNNIK